jgi:hypothetical protein
MAASGTTKKITSNQILGAGGTATLASATITGDLTVDTSTLKVDSANNRVGIGTATPDNQLSVRAAVIATIDVRGGAGGAGALQISGNGTTLGTTSFDLIQNSSGALVYQRDALPLFFYVNGSERYAISSSGVATWSNVGGVAGTAMTLNSTGLGVGVTPSASGGCLQLKSGITFPATQVASSDANTLDDYEEGTWTGTLKGSVSDPTTPVTATGIYTKVGKLVTITIAYSNVNTTGASGNVTITGLPFAGAATGAGSVITFDMFTTSTTLACWNVGTTIAFYVSGGFIPATHNAGASRNVNVTMTYFV